jgi:uncharacterized membrane protein
MNWTLFISIAALIIGPATGLVVALVANHRSKKDTEANINIADRTVDVAAKEADTRAFSAVMEAFEVQLRVTTDRANKLEEKVADLETRLNERDLRAALMLNHISTLERLVPVPPGVPPRTF